jgi:H+/Na+-translocating ferredoxin:NAD+ oxidoreductase subunit D
MMRFETRVAPYAMPANSVGRVMRLVLIALMPAALVHAYCFGWGLIINAGLASATALAAEALALRARGQRLKRYLSDGSALVTAILLAFAIPPLAPWWLTVTGAVFAIVVAKHLYGGLGYNPFNPAMVGYAVLLVSFPGPMTTWVLPAVGHDGAHVSFGQSLAVTFAGGTPPGGWDALTGATALDQVRSGLGLGFTMQEIAAGPAFGALGGRGWEWVSLAALAGGLFLLARRIIRWHIPGSMLAALALLATLMHGIDPGTYPGVTFHLLSGATMLGAFFIATDPVSAATSDRGRLIYGAGIGTLTYVIRAWGGYPDGVAFAVLIMNFAAPMIDRYTVPRIYGHER